MENLRDPRVRQQFLQQSIAQNRAASSKKQTLMQDTGFVRRLISLYESIEEQRYNRLKRRLYSL